MKSYILVDTCSYSLKKEDDVKKFRNFCVIYKYHVLGEPTIWQWFARINI